MAHLNCCYILPFGGFLGTTAKLGPQARSDLCKGGVRHVDNPICLGIITVAVYVIVTHVVAVVVVILVFDVVIDCIVATVK